MSVGAWVFLSVFLGWTLMAAAFLRACWMALACPASLVTRCPRCTYPVDPRVGLRCPECGGKVEDALDLNLRRRGIGSFAILAALFAGGLLSLKVLPGVFREGRWSVMPSFALVRWGPMHFGKEGQAELLRRVSQRSLNAADREALAATCVEMLGPRRSAADQKLGFDIGLMMIQSEGAQGWRVVVGALETPDMTIRQRAFDAIKDDEECPRVVVERVATMVNSDADLQTRQAALLTIRACKGRPLACVREAYLSAMRSGDREFAVFAAMSTNIYGMPRELRDGITDLMSDPDEWRQRLAMLALTHDRRLRAELLDIAKSPDRKMDD